ncbi:MAG TPA: Ig-like domain-containing protein, partial [Verrucomicrobiae bacterium]|nr:Ig-like domain-containing protein [Verrucomicrobiae bacterium]
MLLTSRSRQAGLNFLILALVLGLPITRAAEPPPISINRAPGGQLQLTWPEAAGTVILEASPALGPNADWNPVTAAPVPNGVLQVVTLDPVGEARFLRLRSDSLTGIASASPAPGESGVAVTRETILRFDRPLAAGTVLAVDRFYAEFGGRRMLSRVELSADRQTATLFYLENLPAAARVRVVFDGAGLLDSLGQQLDADNDGIPGGSAAFSFLTASTTALAGTAVIGHVYASESNGSGNVPLANVTIT